MMRETIAADVRLEIDNQAIVATRVPGWIVDSNAVVREARVLKVMVASRIARPYTTFMILHTGEALIDFIPKVSNSGEQTYRPVPGGSPYNTAVATARLGVPNTFFGKISTDFFGEQLVNHLTGNGVGIDYVHRDARLSTLAFVQRSPGGDARYAFFAENAADRSLSIDDLPRLPESIRAIQFGSISLIADPVGDTIINLVEKESRKRVISFDPNIREGLITDEKGYRRRLKRAIAASTIVKISDEDTEWIYPGYSIDQAAEEMIRTGVLLVVVTAGGDGSRAFTAETSATVAAEPITVVDTVGAGDSFHGGLLAWLYYTDELDSRRIASLSQGRLTELLRFAGAVSAQTCSRSGNDPPRIAELPEDIKGW